MIGEVSLIIPSNNDEKNLLKLLQDIATWDKFPSEIIIVDSSDHKITMPKSFYLFVKKNDIKFKIIKDINLYPGHARNIGIRNSVCDTLAFLDTSTHPSKTWLSSGLEIIHSTNSEGVWGATFYNADKFTAKIIRASTFGGKPIKTFPGSIIDKDVFAKCGLFIESTRAGEDSDWMSRASLHSINISSPRETLNYDKLNNQNFVVILKKWFRNYTHAAHLPNFRAHKDFYFYAISTIGIISAYNWNSIMAAWQTDSLYYIPNVTKISLAVFVTFYALSRGIWLPNRKGISLRFILPFNFIFICFFSALIDFTKAIAFTYSKFSKKIK
jgi:glycosyltransferase involved in cell wall biosynthesis